MDNVKSQLRLAIEKESKQFKEYYLWLEKSMPKEFFNDISFDDIILITHSLMGFHLEEYYSQINVSKGAIVLTLEQPESDINILKKFSLYGIRYYCAYLSKEAPPIEGVKNRLRIVIIKFFENPDQEESLFDEPHKEEIKKLVQERNPDIDDENFEHLLSQIKTPFLATQSNKRIALALDMFERAQTRDHCQYEVSYNEDWKETSQPSMHIVFAWRNTSRANFFYHLAKVIYRHNLVMKRVHASHINPHTDQNILIMVIGLQGNNGKAAWEVCDTKDLLKELVTVKYFAQIDSIEKTYVNTRLIRGNLANFIRSSIDFIHQVLLHLDAYEYTLENIEKALCKHPDLVELLCQAFEYKFNPDLNDIKKYRDLRDKLLSSIEDLDTGKEKIDQRHKNILKQAANFVEFCLKTNFYRNNKISLSFRLDPHYLDHVPYDRNTLFPVLPYAIFYIKGLCFFGFHIRFKNLSRGGLRTVLPKKTEYAYLDRNEVFMETYSLAFTQQKKNKDIPEGGSKAVIFLDPSRKLELDKELYLKDLKKQRLNVKEIQKKLNKAASIDKLFYLHQSQRAFVDGLLTLVNCEEDGTLRAKHMLNYYNKPEYIYLGPDENMHIEIIEWIAKHSQKYHYRPGSSFISSKPGIGINHKEHGVTSLGVNVCMHEVLEYLGIDPKKDSFTVKMSGGPDGDVAGNQMLNLLKYYPSTAKLLTTIDVSGTIYDPNGLDLSELKRLFEQEKPINCYDPSKLSDGGFLLDTLEKKDHSAYSQQTLCYKKEKGKLVEEWLSGNEMNNILRHTVHKTVADVFIPCGGRPATININNYQDFLTKEKRPTSKAIIEGANLYITPKARRALEELGVLIFRDSSANKGGVIASSFEVLCGLTLNDEEMLKYHQNIVDETLAILSQRALDEAQLMLRTHKENGMPLTEISEKVSQKINLYTYQLLDHLEAKELSNDPNNQLIKCFLAYCPEFLRKEFSDRLIQEIPDMHKKAIIACYLGSRVVYKMGLDWSPTLVGILPILLADPEVCDSQ